MTIGLAIALVVLSLWKWRMHKEGRGTFSEVTLGFFIFVTLLGLAAAVITKSVESNTLP